MRKHKKTILVLGIITVSLVTTLFLLGQILAASERFELVFDGKAVLDKQTGLIWERSPDTTKRTYTSACDCCSTKEVAGRKGWRLPTIEELGGIVDTSHGPPTLPSGHPFNNVQSDYYWSSSHDIYGSIDWVHCLNFYGGSIFSLNKTEPWYVWCVQAGR